MFFIQQISVNQIFLFKNQSADYHANNNVQYLLQNMLNKQRTKIGIEKLKISIIIFVITFLSQSQKNVTCSDTCEICSTNSSFCSACVDGYQLSHIGQCIPSNTVQNCQLFGLRDTCLNCKPTFRLLSSNACVKMGDGCLIAGTAGGCIKCLEGAVKNEFGQCENKYLNCLKISQNRQCILCQRGYKLESGRCKNNDQNCQFVQPVNGLCMLCKKGYKLVQYRCVKPEQVQNCYIISQDFQTCSFCKSGYESYYGKCYTTLKIDVLIYQGNVTKKCTSRQYYDLRSQLCYPQPQYCERFDFGFMRCVSCLSNYVIIGGLCRDPSLRYCQKIDGSNPYICQFCIPKFFLTSNNMCKQYPPFCEQVSNQKCVKCIDLFLLNSKGTCEDPNCEVYDNTLLECIKCKASYFKDMSTSICTFQDINCIEAGANQTCKKCRTDYVYDSSRKICKFVDPNCKIFSQKQICIQCRTGFYINDKNNICMELPYKCLSADSQGRCKYCAEGYALLTTRQCSLIVSISNCLASSTSNYNVCKVCKEGFYVDQKGTCLDLPSLCQQFDSVKRLCLKCNQNSENRRGFCYDNYCQVFGEAGKCLGCKPGYQFGKKGECIPEQSDSNCKQFMNGQCRVCSDRYYFNSAWKCTNVSTLCRNYDPNNGDCTSCYSGYALEEGNCIRQSQRVFCQVFTNSSKMRCKKCKNKYKLDERDGQCYLNDHGCIKRGVTNKTCLKCAQSYLLDEGTGYCLKILNGTVINPNPNNNKTDSSEEEAYVDVNCIEYNGNRSMCNKCISRMYYSKQNGSNRCMVVDPNCKNYIQVTGECTECYEGYTTNAANKLKCVLSKPKDINCKVFAPSGDSCIQCYAGFYYSAQQKLCVLVDSLCKTSDSSDGKCLSCWSGYALTYGRCVINPNEPPTVAPSPPTQINNTNPKKIPTGNQESSRCEQYDSNLKRCIKCINGAAYDEQTKNCEFPLLGIDFNCVQYRFRICTKCVDKFKLINKKCTS